MKATTEKPKPALDPLADDYYRQLGLRSAAVRAQRRAEAAKKRKRKC